MKYLKGFIYIHSFILSFVVVVLILHFIPFGFFSSSLVHLTATFYLSCCNKEYKTFIIRYVHLCNWNETEYENGRIFFKCICQNLLKNDFGFSVLLFSDWKGVAFTLLNIYKSSVFDGVCRMFTIVPLVHALNTTI